MTRTIALGVTMLAIAAAHGAPSGKTVKSHDGVCQASVPATWDTSAGFGLAYSRDQMSSIAVTTPEHANSFNDAKENAKKSNPDLRVIKNTATEFEMYSLPAGRPHMSRSIPVAGGKFCTVDVFYRGLTVDDAHNIAETLKSAK